jgi:hypothetical protein
MRFSCIVAIFLIQADDDEKAVQVPLMGKFYKLSSRCIIWLGTGDTLSDTAMFFIPWVVMYMAEEGSTKHHLEAAEHK